MTKNHDKLCKAIKFLAEQELIAGDEQYGAFHSRHEGYAVLNEEIDELSFSVNRVDTISDALWTAVKKDQSIDRVLSLVESIEHYALNAAEEAIQVMAMCQKFKTLLEKEKCDESSPAQ